eukprot:scaffold61616_cov33-Phaeocystis_antarctica.AAC.2
MPTRIPPTPTTPTTPAPTPTTPTPTTLRLPGDAHGALPLGGVPRVPCHRLRGGPRHRDHRRHTEAAHPHRAAGGAAAPPVPRREQACLRAPHRAHGHQPRRRRGRRERPRAAARRPDP